MENCRDGPSDFLQICIHLGLVPTNTSVMVAEGLQKFVFPFLALIEEALVQEALKTEESSELSAMGEIAEAPDIFISHSSLDKQVAKALIAAFEAAFEPIEIRCSSVSGYKFTTGGDFRQQIRAEVERLRVFVALLTPRSLRAPEVLFEIGARWQTGKALIPLIAAGAEPKAFQDQ